MIKQLAAAMCAVALTAASVEKAKAQDPQSGSTWQTLSYADAGFSVEAPAPPTVQTLRIRGFGGNIVEQLYTFSVDGRSHGEVDVFDWPDGSASAAEILSTLMRQDPSRVVNGRLVSSLNIRLAGYPGVAILVIGTSSHFREKTFILGRHVISIGTSDFPQTPFGPESDRFYASLKLLTPRERSTLSGPIRAGPTPFPTCPPNMLGCIETFSAYLSPSAFPELPAAVRADLERRHCSIPQVRLANWRTNVIHGAFESPGRTDWAALCMRGRISSILLYRGGSTAAPKVLPNSGNFIATTDAAGIRQGWSISRHIRTHATGTISLMTRRCLDSGGVIYGFDVHPGRCVRLPARIDHQGISNGNWADGSFTFYYYRGKWLILPAGE
jgi:hypothetical protein